MASKSNVIAITGMIAILLILLAGALIGVGIEHERVPSIHLSAQSNTGPRRVHVDAASEPVSVGDIAAEDAPDESDSRVELRPLTMPRWIADFLHAPKEFKATP